MGEVPRRSASRAPAAEPIDAPILADTRSGVARITASTATLLAPEPTVKAPRGERPMAPTGLPSTVSMPAASNARAAMAP